MELRLEDLATNYVDTCSLTVSRGDRVEVRGMMTHEIVGVTLHFRDSTKPMLPIGVGRAVSPKLAAVEALSMIGGTWVPELIRRAAPRYDDVLVSGDDDFKAVYAAYGPRILGHVDDVVKLLQSDATSRQAILSIWRVDDLTHEGDKPCTLTLQFLIRHDKLHCVASMRSQDVWLGLAMDAFVFTQLQHTLARMLHVQSGSFTLNVGSFHAYERDFEKIEDMHSVLNKSLTPLPLGVMPCDGRTGISDPIGCAYSLINALQHNKKNVLVRHAQDNPWYVDKLSRLLVGEKMTPADWGTK